jgi:hypothetical protein
MPLASKYVFATHQELRCCREPGRRPLTFLVEAPPSNDSADSPTASLRYAYWPGGQTIRLPNRTEGWTSTLNMMLMVEIYQRYGKEILRPDRVAPGYP